jgi:Flp pilus assembly protein TadG
MRCPRRSRRPLSQQTGDCPGLWRIGDPRRGAAVVELAVLLPLLILLFVIAVDFSRAYYFSLTLQNCARAGAVYASDPVVARESPYASAEEAALADATSLSPSPTIATAEGLDTQGRPYVEVKATYPYRTVLQFPGIPAEMTLSRSVRMYYAAIVPDAN